MYVLPSRAYIVKPKSSEELVLDVIFQVRMNVNNCPGGKLKVLQDIYELLTIQQSIVFVEMKREAERIARMMQDAGLNTSVNNCFYSIVLRIVYSVTKNTVHYFIFNTNCTLLIPKFKLVRFFCIIVDSSLIKYP